MKHLLKLLFVLGIVGNALAQHPKLEWAKQFGAPPTTSFSCDGIHFPTHPKGNTHGKRYYGKNYSESKLQCLEG